MALQRGGSTTIVDTLHMRYHQEDRWSRSANQLKIKSNTADSPCSLQRRCTWLTTDWGCLHTSFHTAMAMVVVAMAMAVAAMAVAAAMVGAVETAMAAEARAMAAAAMAAAMEGAMAAAMVAAPMEAGRTQRAAHVEAS